MQVSCNCKGNGGGEAGCGGSGGNRGNRRRGTAHGRGSRSTRGNRGRGSRVDRGGGAACGAGVLEKAGAIDDDKRECACLARFLAAAFVCQSNEKGLFAEGWKNAP